MSPVGSIVFFPQQHLFAQVLVEEELILPGLEQELKEGERCMIAKGFGKKVILIIGR